MTDLDDLLDRVDPVVSLPEPAERRCLREAARLTQAEVARALGVSTASVGRWEAGSRTPDRHHVNAYARFLVRLAERVDRG